MQPTPTASIPNTLRLSKAPFDSEYFMIILQEFVMFMKVSSIIVYAVLKIVGHVAVQIAPIYQEARIIVAKMVFKTTQLVGLMDKKLHVESIMVI